MQFIPIYFFIEQLTSKDLGLGILEQMTARENRESLSHLDSLLGWFAGLAAAGAAHEPGGAVCAGRGSGPDQRGAQVRGRHQEDQHCGRPQAGRRQPQAKDGHIFFSFLPVLGKKFCHNPDVKIWPQYLDRNL